MREVVICDKCSGTGYITKEVLEDYHNCIYRTSHSLCNKCSGYGRMYKETTITYTPFIPLKL